MIVDTNVLLDVLNDDPAWVEWSLRQLRTQSQIHRLAINAVIYAELSLSFSTVQGLDDAIAGMALAMLEIPRPALFLAGKAFALYRRRGGIKSNVLSDFFIGAHAAVADLPILTRDTSRYASYFPTVRLIAP
ncbi:type II toxin-antitoxin system VapC family toxin [Ottowia testudinis]|uniref:Type II toxin-antitoxin system VapC family toxin n=1 Tax=Ottowia testudinis TaxID=2816950 RepID=A0A975CHM7_9BURK|nr:type II toxin-antitoxin system VapC family toxin [Ottowia testudinis]QTD45082.1 type II toxin-antitoxin system VapC family toxin [Ottowia testudinis]